MEYKNNRKSESIAPFTLLLIFLFIVSLTKAAASEDGGDRESDEQEYSHEEQYRYVYGEQGYNKTTDEKYDYEKEDGEIEAEDGNNQRNGQNWDFSYDFWDLGENNYKRAGTKESANVAAKKRIENKSNTKNETGKYEYSAPEQFENETEPIENETPEQPEEPQIEVQSQDTITEHQNDLEDNDDGYGNDLINESVHDPDSESINSFEIDYSTDAGSAKTNDLKDSKKETGVFARILIWLGIIK